MKTLVIVPSYNEAQNIVKLIEKIKTYGFDYLIINDNSSDNTKEIIEANQYTYIDLSINIGLAGVTRVGFKYAVDNGYDCVISIDGDGQHLPEYMEKLLVEIENGYDYVVGSRFIETKKPSSLRMIGSRFLCFLIKLKTKKTVTDPTSGMRALGKRTLEDFAESMNYYAEPDALCHCLKNNYKVKEVQVEMKERSGGKSYFTNPFKSIKFMIANVISIIFIQ